MCLWARGGECAQPPGRLWQAVEYTENLKTRLGRIAAALRLSIKL